MHLRVRRWSSGLVDMSACTLVACHLFPCGLSGGWAGGRQGKLLSLIGLMTHRKELSDGINLVDSKICKRKPTTPVFIGSPPPPTNPHYTPLTLNQFHINPSHPPHRFIALDAHIFPTPSATSGYWVSASRSLNHNRLILLPFG